MSQTQTTDNIFHRVLREKWKQISYGRGVYLFDTKGQRYLDAFAGVHVVSIGHGIQEVVEAMAEQASNVCFTYSRFITQPQIEALTPGELNRVFFVSGGSEATESAIRPENIIRKPAILRSTR